MKSIKMRSIILFMFIFVVGMLKCEAQVGHYYKSITLKYQQKVIRSDDSTIVVQDNNTKVYYFFKEGFCTSMLMYYKGRSDRKWIEVFDKLYDKSEHGNWWYSSIDSDNGKKYHVIIEVWYDDGDIPYCYAYLNAKID